MSSVTACELICETGPLCKCWPSEDICVCYLDGVLLFPTFIDFWFLSEIVVKIQEILIQGLGSEWPPGPCWIMFYYRILSLAKWWTQTWVLNKIVFFQWSGQLFLLPVHLFVEITGSGWSNYYLHYPPAKCQAVWDVWPFVYTGWGAVCVPGFNTATCGFP